MKKIVTLLLCGLLAACQQPAENTGIAPQRLTDAVHAVLESDRAVYTQKIVNRLTVENNVIKASEHWEEDKALALPAQMFRMGAERVNEMSMGISYALISEWAINKKNLPRTDAEKAGVAAVAADPRKNYYTEEELGGKKYFTAIYADVAVAEACVKCHNDHKDSPRNDFKRNDVMGAVVVRLEL